MGEWTDVPDIVDALAARLGEFDWQQAATITESLIHRLNAATERFPEKQAPPVLNELRRKRQFVLMARLAQAFVASGRSEAVIRRQHAQALIDQGNLDAAEPILTKIVFDPTAPARELVEARGLLGRIYKQRYVDAGGARQPDSLRQAIAHYDAVYSTEPGRLWHGINVVACLARAKRDGVDVSAVERKSFGEIAANILERLQTIEEQDGRLYYWDRATSMEAHIALAEFEHAMDDLRVYVRDRDTDAFECFSTLRQLREVWQIDETENGGHGATIVAALNSALLKRSGGEVQLQAGDVQRGLQANFSAVADLPLQWWRSGLERCAAIARIEDLQGRKRGTGFLVRRGDFLGDDSEERLLLTNWHVISERGVHPRSVPPGAARAHFEAGGCAFRVSKEIVAYSRALDACFLRLEGFQGIDGHCPLEPMPAAFTPTKPPRVYVIGYPGGRNLSFSIHDSIWLDTDGTKLHYRTPTEPGSSGSPVFDQDHWVLLALHHAGLEEMPRLKGKSGTYQANEGIAITAIQEALKTNLKS
jgi:hypothetical protein